MNGITYVGLDAHKKAINVAMLLPRVRTPTEWTVENEPGAIRRLTKRVERETKGEIRFCYEAGPCGYALQRLIQASGSRSVCEVVAPALIPTKPGERIKTDRRDARKLAELLRADLLTEVQPPSEAEESVRDLCRCREDARRDLHRARQRLSKLLLRRGLSYTAGKKDWTRAYWDWLKSLHFDHPAERTVFDDYVLAIVQLEERIKVLDERLAAIAEQPEHKALVGRLRCFRGIDVTTAMCLCAELYRFDRFASPRGLMAYLGLVPSEHSSSDMRRRGGITKSGNGHVRSLLIETAWHYRHPPCVGKKLRARRNGQPAHVIAIAEKAQHRLSRRYRAMTERCKPANKIVVAIARELVGFLWAALQPLTAVDALATKSPARPKRAACSRFLQRAAVGSAAGGSGDESSIGRHARRHPRLRQGAGTA